jgi:SAM-dependent methyltransferase
MSIPSYKSGWNNIDDMADPHHWVRFMDRINQEDKGEFFLEDELTINWLALQEGQRVLEVGCGTGGMARGLAQVVGAGGQVVGIDLSETMLVEARRRSMNVPNVEFLQADVHQLPFADQSFDRCYSRNVFEVVEDPRRAISEMVRVLRPGGIVVIPAPDYGSMAIDGSDRALTRTIINYIGDVESNGWMGRQLPYLFVQTGLGDIKIDVTAHVCNDFQYFFENWLGASLGRAIGAGVVTEDQARVWLTEQQEHYRKHVFFEVNTVFTVRGVKP